MQALKHMINYDWLLQRIDRFQGILAEARDVFFKVKDEAVDELKGIPGDLTFINGDFWTGNILLPNSPIQEGIEISILVIYWDMAQLGVQKMDHAQMIGELYELWLYQKVDTGLWMVQGYAEGLWKQTNPFVWRIAIQVGCHVLSFGTVGPGWDTPGQVEDVARLGRDMSGSKSVNLHTCLLRPYETKGVPVKRLQIGSHELHTIV